MQEKAAALEERVKAVLAAEGVDAPVLEASMDLRYRGQATNSPSPLDLPAPTATQASHAVQRSIEAFHAAHEARYGYAMPSETVESVAVRLRGTGAGAELSLPQEPLGLPTRKQRTWPPNRFGSVQIVQQPTACYDRLRLRPGHRLKGPALVFQFDTTTVVAPGWSARVDERHNLL